jgi:transcriptional regulator with XRE-family HTH domain
MPSQANYIGSTNMARSQSDARVGAVIAAARKALGLRQADLARIINVKQSSISQWESNKFTPELDSRILLAEALHLSLHDLMPDGPPIPEDALKDPQIRRIVDNCLQLDLGDRQAVELISMRLRERRGPQRR